MASLAVKNQASTRWFTFPGVGRVLNLMQTGLGGIILFLLKFYKLIYG